MKGLKLAEILYDVFLEVLKSDILIVSNYLGSCRKHTQVVFYNPQSGCNGKVSIR